MVFNSLGFLCFFAVLWPLYLAVGRRPQNALLLVASYVFYGLGDWRYVPLLAGTTLFDYGAGRLLAVDSSVQGIWRRRLILLASVSVNLGLLGYFKYRHFFWDSFAPLFGSGVVAPLAQVFLPAGISFYTFQSLSYVVDVYRKRVAPVRSLADYGLFVSFFPHLVAGPIVRPKLLLPQIETPRLVTPERLRAGVFLVLLGYFKKVVVADNLAPFVALLHRPGDLSGGQLAVGCYCMAFFLYTDFAGYSDIARGLGQLLGFELPQNFRMPLFAKSPLDFWHRWHVTLSEWFRDYVFTPLIRLRPAVIPGRLWAGTVLMVTAALAGLWHGAAWNFLVFGLYHGALLVLTVIVRGLWRRSAGRRLAARLPSAVRRTTANVVTFHLVSAAAVLFFLPHPADWRLLVNGIVHGAYDGEALPALWTLLAFVGPMALIEGLQEAKGDILFLARGPAWRLSLTAAGLLALILLCGASTTHAFVYFRF